MVTTRNRSVEAERRHSVRKRVRKYEYVEDYKKDKTCIDCNSSGPLEFDHVRGVKVTDIARMMRANNYTLGALIKEIAKCDLRCRPCHDRKDGKRYRKV